MNESFPIAPASAADLPAAQPTFVVPTDVPVAETTQRPERVGVLLVNLGTPDTADAAGRAGLSEGISLRSAGDRGSGTDVEADPQRHHSARAPRAARRATTGRSGTPRTTNPRSRPSRARRPRSWRLSIADHDHVVVDWAMRYGNPSIALAHRGADGAGLRPSPGGAALSAIFRRDLGDRLRRGVSRAGRHARAADAAGDAALLRRSRSTSRRWRSRSMRIWRPCRFSPN